MKVGRTRDDAGLARDDRGEPVGGVGTGRPPADASRTDFAETISRKGWLP